MPRQTDVTETQAWVKLLLVFCISIKSFGNIHHVQFTDELHGSIVAMPFFSTYPISLAMWNYCPHFWSSLIHSNLGVK